MTYTRGFCELNRTDRAIAGGKGAYLGDMHQADVPVPPGFVIIGEAFDAFLEANGLTGFCDLSKLSPEALEIDAVDAFSATLRARITAAEVPPSMAEEINCRFAHLHAPLVAVRSSATSEDGASQAWAGQLATYLDTDAPHLLANLKCCWASLFTARAISYRAEAGLLAEPIAVAVVVQAMLASKASGVAFSVHPVTENANQMVIEAGFGLGEAVVSGAITPDNYVVAKDSLEILEKTISRQTMALSHGSEGDAWRRLSAKDGRLPKLAEAKIKELARLVLKVEQHFGFPCDIEWALQDDTLYIVQCRPITTLRG